MKKRPANRIIIIVAIGVALVGLGRLGALRPITQTLGVVTSPVMKLMAGSGSSVSNFFDFMGKIKDLNRRNIELTSEVRDLKQQLAADVEMRVQNTALRKQLGFSNPSNQAVVPAEIVAYQPDNFRAFVTINRGRRDGLRNGMAVTSQGSLLGKLVNTQENTSQVFLLNDPDFKVAAIDQNTRTTGIVHGQIGKGLVLTNVPQDQIVKTGDMLVTSGLGGDFPKGLIIGKIETISRQDNAIFQSAAVVPSVKINQLELVFIMISP